MQELTPTECAKAEIHATKQLIDTRDGKAYWVTKLKDGNCWMSQNLDLDLSTDKKLTMANGSAIDYTPLANTIKDQQFGGEIDGVALNDNAKAYYSWDERDYVVIQPDLYNKGLSFGFTQAQGGINGLTNPEKIIEASLNGWEGSDQYTESLKASPILTQYGIVKDVSNTSNWRASTDPNFTQSSTYINGNNAIANKNTGWSIACENDGCTAGVYDAHYLVGNYYQWLVATALTAEQGAFYNGSTAERAQVPANQSICPAGWQLPLSNRSGVINNDSTSGSFYNLIKNHYGIFGYPSSGAEYNINASPLFFNRAGGITASDQSESGYVGSVGYKAYYWSSMASSSTWSVFLYMADYTGYQQYSRSFGASVRCLVLSAENQ